MRRLEIPRRAASTIARVLMIVLIAAGVPGVALAQPIERNLPPTSETQPQDIMAPNAVPASQDSHPIGPALKGLLLLGPSDAVRTAPVEGVVPGLVPRIDTPRGWLVLRPFIGQPMSRKLIARIEASIARYYRRTGFPFVSISTPPQRIGDGVLQVRVVEFQDGLITVSGVKGRGAQRVRADVRLQPAQPVDARQLSADLEWLNRYPFHHVEAVFSPGDTLGRTDLHLEATTAKPWQIYTGYANSGSSKTSYDRYLLGGEVGGLLGANSLVSYQFTASPDAFDKDGRPFGDVGQSRYVSHGLRAAVPVAPRQEIEASFDHVETNTPSDPFLVRQITDELSLGYRTSLSNISSAPGELSLGIEAKQERRKTFFEGVDVLNATVQVYQLYVGWSAAWSDPFGKNALALTFHDSPGDVNRFNDRAALTTFTNGRVINGDYQYLNAQFSRTTRLPARWTLNSAIIVQYADAALPDTEQMGVGGSDLVRGYTLDDGAYDSAVVFRNELRPPAFQLSTSHWPVGDEISPFAFVDAGYGTQRVTRQHLHPASIGLGADDQLGGHIYFSVTGAYALSNAILARKGDVRLESRATFTF
jgi:hemolysin activation/secretion protein